MNIKSVPVHNGCNIMWLYQRAFLNTQFHCVWCFKPISWCWQTIGQRKHRSCASKIDTNDWCTQRSLFSLIQFVKMHGKWVKMRSINFLEIQSNRMDLVTHKMNAKWTFIYSIFEKKQEQTQTNFWIYFQWIWRCCTRHHSVQSNINSIVVPNQLENFCFHIFWPLKTITAQNCARKVKMQCLKLSTLTTLNLFIFIDWVNPLLNQNNPFESGFVRERRCEHLFFHQKWIHE